MITRPDWIWSRYFEEAIDASAASFVAVHLDSTSHPDGYVHYDVSWQDAFSEAPAGQGKIHELYGADAGVELALWRYLLDIDLVKTWRADERPLDDVAKFVVADSRAYAIKAVGDEQWLRILDVDVALGTRTYNATDRSVTIMVRDPLIANNAGTWQVDAYGAYRSHNEPDLIVGIETLSAAYMGGTPWWALHAAGHVRAQRPEQPSLTPTTCSPAAPCRTAAASSDATSRTASHTTRPRPASPLHVGRRERPQDRVPDELGRLRAVDGREHARARRYELDPAGSVSGMDTTSEGTEHVRGRPGRRASSGSVLGSSSSRRDGAPPRAGTATSMIAFEGRRPSGYRID